MKVLIAWSKVRLQSEIRQDVEISKTGLAKIRILFIKTIEDYFRRNPIILGHPGAIVQVDEIMVNHEIKAHRDRGPRMQM